MSFYVNIKNDEKENKWKIETACYCKQNSKDQKFWNQARCDSEGTSMESDVLDSYTLRSCKKCHREREQRFWIGTLWSPAKKTSKGKPRGSGWCSASEPKVKSSVLRWNNEQTWAVQCIWHVRRTQKFCIVLSQWVNIRSLVCVNSEKNHGSYVC